MRPLLPAVLAALLLAPVARAATYEHASLPPGGDGWSPAVSAPLGWVAAAGGADGLSAQFWARQWFAPGDRVDWVYAAPPGTEVRAWTAEREVSGIGPGDWNVVVWAVEDGRSRAVVADVPAVDRPWGPVVVGGLHAERLVVRIACGGPHDCARAGAAVRLRLRGAVAVLRDDEAPEVGRPQGDLADAATLRGVARLSAPATDRGGGLRRTVVEVDGRPAWSAPVAGGVACEELAPRRYGARVPCPLRASVDAALDTRTLPDGPHEVRVLVEDAAGNRATVLGPSTRVVDNVPGPGPGGTVPRAPVVGGPAPARPAPGAPARVRAWIVDHGRRARAVTVRHGRAVRVRGSVRDAAGGPLAAATVTLRARVAGRRWRAAALARTRADGRFSALVGRGSSRRIVALAAGGSSRALRLRVRPAVRLRGVRHGGWLTLAGRLRGGHVPATGVLVTIQGLRAHRWVALTTVRSDRHGRFRARVPAAAAPRVRAAVARQPGYPFAAGASPARSSA